MASEIVGKLEELGNLLVDCRDIPPVFFDEYGIKNFPKGPYGVGDFLIFPEHESGEEAGSPVEGYYKISLIGGEKVTHPENNRFNAMVLADLERAYYFSRTDIGCIGEAITLADLNYMRKIDGKTHTGYDASSCLILGNKILQIGRNENFRPETPHLLSEEEYAPELLKEFSGFLEEKHKGTHETVVKETGNLMKISLEGIGPLRLEIPPEDIDNLISRFTGLLQAYEETKNS